MDTSFYWCFREGERRYVVVVRGLAGAHIWREDAMTLGDREAARKAQWLAETLSDRVLTVAAIKAEHTTRRGKVRALRRYALRILQEEYNHG